MATTRDRYILDVDTRSATRAVENLKRSIDGIGGSQTQQRIRQLQQSFNNVKVDRLNREIEQLKRRLDELSRTRADDQLRDTDRAADGAADSMGRLRGAIAGVVGAISVAAFVGFVRNAAEAKVQMDALTNSLTTFVGSGSRAEAEMRRIRDLANEMGVDVQGLAGAFNIFSRFGLDTSSEALQSWTNIAMATGKSMEQLGEAVADALTGEFERLKEFGIKVSQENGVFTASIAGQQDIIANSTTELITKLQALGATGGAWAGGIERNSNSLGGSMNRLRNAVNEVTLSFIEGLEPALIEVNNKIATLLLRNTELANSLGRGLGEALNTVISAVEGLGSVLGVLNEALKLAGIAIAIGLLRQFSAAVITAADGVVGATQTLKIFGQFSMTALRSLPIIGTLISGIAAAFSLLTAPVLAVVAAIALLDRAIKYAFDVSIINTFFSVLWDIVSAIPSAIGEIASEISDLWNIMGGDFPSLDEVLALDDTEAKLAELKRRYEGLVILGSQEDVDRGREMIKLLEDAAAATEMLRLAEESAAEATAAREQMISGILAPYQEAIAAAEQFAATDYSTPAEAVNNRVDAARQTIAQLEQAFTDLQNKMAGGLGISEGMANTIWPEYAELIAAARRELEAATQAKDEFIQRGEEGTLGRYFYDLVEGAKATVQETEFARYSLEDLQTALENGAISQEVYAVAVERLNQALGIEAPRTYASVMAELNTTFAENQAIASVNAEVMAGLAEQYSAGVISLQQYSAGVSELGQNFNEYLLSIGDVDAYLRNLQSTVESSIRADETKAAAIRQLTADFDAGRIAPELYRQMMSSLGVEIDAVTGRTRELQNALDALTGTADQALQSMEERIRAAQEQAELSGYEGIKRTLRAIILEENRLRDATIERLRAQALAGEISETELNAQIARIEEQTRATIAARQRAAEIEDANRETAERAREAMRPVTPNIRTPAVPQTPGSMWDRIFGGANAGGISAGGPNGSRSNPLYVIPVFGSIKDLVDNISKSVINASDLTGNVTGVLNSLSAPIASANRGSGFLGSLFGGFFATGGNIPPGRYGIVGESGPEVVEGPATVTPITGQQVVYNINAVDVRSFQDMLARDPGFVHAVVQRAQRRVPGAR